MIRNCVGGGGSRFRLLHSKGKRDWALDTLMTVLSRLCDKGYLLCEKRGWSNHFIPEGITDKLMLNPKPDLKDLDNLTT
jgi:hypothetical protein